MRSFTISTLLAIAIITSYSCSCFSEFNKSESIIFTSKAQKQNDLELASSGSSTKKSVLRYKILHEGDFFAAQGNYEKALSKFNEAMRSEYLNKESDKSAAQMRIVWAHKRQGKFNLALKEHSEWLYNKHPNHELTIDEHLELVALVKAFETGNSTFLYEYISYLKNIYMKQLPPNGYATGFSNIIINRIIHLYDYLNNYDAGITFVDDIIKYHTQHPDRNHRSAHAKDVKEYARVKQAWELDKKTGQHSHLQDVIRTSDVISW
jgi:hypothetical protein